MLNHWQRSLAYLTECIVVGLAVAVFTHSLFKFADVPGAAGYITLFGFGFGFLNLSFVINRRFVLKTDQHRSLNYLFSALMLAPSLFWMFTKDTGLGHSRLTFTLTICFAAFLGTYFGIRRGFAKRQQYWEAHPDYTDEDLPEELKRPHDKVSNN